MKIREFFRVAWTTAEAIRNRILFGEHFCSECGKLLPKGSMLVDYCIDCAKKREEEGREKI